MVPKPSSDGYYHRYVKDPSKASGRRQIKARTLNELELKTENYIYGGISFKAVYELSQKEQIKYVKNNDKRLSVANTIKRHNSDYKRYFAGTRFERLPINKISSKDIKNHCEDTLINNNLRRRAFNNYIGILRQTFIFALDEELIKENPVSTINFASPKFTNMLSEDSSIEDRIYSEKDYNRMINYIHAKQEEFPKSVVYYALEYQILLGERRGEVAPSKWEDIKEENGIRYVEIRREMLEGDGRHIVEHTKTSKNRRVPIWSDLDEFLYRLKAFHDQNDIYSEYLFPSKRSKYGCIDLRTPYKAFHQMCEDLGIELTLDLPKGTHAYRRNFAKRIDNAALSSKLLGNTEKVLKTNYYDGLDLGRALAILNGNHSR